MKAQIPLSFPVVESMGHHDFMPADCNQQALDWIDRFPNWSYPAVIIYGEKGCGKTHLLNIWRDIARNQGQAIDDVDTLFGDQKKETELFHLFNQAKENKTYLFLSMSKIKEFDRIGLPDLASRLRAAPLVEITAPDDLALQAVLVKSFHDRQLRVEPGVITYILPRIERSFQSARDLVARLDQAAMAEKRSITVPLVKTVINTPNSSF